MRLPRLDHPERYGGLYLVDLGDTVGVGYTAEEVAMLLESEAYGHAKVYRIHAAHPDGRMELKGVPGERFRLEAGMFFYRRDLPAARDDFDRLRALAEESRLPCRAQLLLGRLPEPARLPYFAGLAYPAEYDEDVSGWMLDHRVEAGDVADGGVGRLEVIRRDGQVIESAQLQGLPGRQARSWEELRAAIGQAIQRTA